MFTVCFYSHDSCHPRFKLKSVLLNIPGFLHPIPLTPAFILYSPLKVRIRSKNRGSSLGTVGIILSFWVVCTVPALSLIFDTVSASIHLEFSISVSVASAAEGASRMEACAYENLFARGCKREHF